MGRALVTGGAGFLGTHLVQRLLDRGLDVVCVDNLSTGMLENVERFGNHSGYTFVQRDVCSFFDLEGSVDFVVHMASPASPVDYLRMPLETMEAGSTGLRNMLDLAVRKGARLLFTSTSEVYGNPLQHPQSESYWGNVNPIGPRSVYDEAKRFGEALVTSYGKVFGLDVRIARIFNTYGPRMRVEDGRVVPSFLCQAIRRESLSVYGTGSQTRSFCYVDDLVDGLVKLLFSDVVGPVNLGNPEECTMADFAFMVQRLFAPGIEVSFHELPDDDPRIRCPDISRARSMLGWAPKVSLEEGLIKTHDWFQMKISHLG